MTREHRHEILQLILFYELYGWDWGPAVSFLCHKYDP